jgi:uncharacterized repeat protein (TIGR03837 family)
MNWDVFCEVIDNFGDIGVCWRLACDLGSRGHTVRLWIDDASALQWMAPHVNFTHDARTGLTLGLGQTGVQVRDWREAANTALQHDPGDVVIEAFGCNPPDAFVASMQARLNEGRQPQWINLEYLSAEDYVERSHGLRSPVWSGAGAGLSKRFFYPGFTPGTGGLLREPGLMATHDAFCNDPSVARRWLASHGVQASADERLISIFCYANAPLDDLLDRLALSADPAAPIHVLTTPGHATELARRWLAHRGLPIEAPLRVSELPALPQAAFEQLLWSCSLNFVRGEDSAVRALWAGHPHIWQIYEQDDGVHADKLNAFTTRWMRDWSPALREQVLAWWRAWNRLGPMPEALPYWHNTQTPWAASSRVSRAALLEQDDLVTQLLQFVSSSG